MECVPGYFDKQLFFPHIAPVLNQIHRQTGSVSPVCSTVCPRHTSSLSFYCQMVMTTHTGWCLFSIVSAFQVPGTAEVTCGAFHNCMLPLIKSSHWTTLLTVLSSIVYKLFIYSIAFSSSQTVHCSSTFQSKVPGMPSGPVAKLPLVLFLGHPVGPLCFNFICLLHPGCPHLPQ